MQKGRFGINEKALADISKERFVELAKGNIEGDLNEAWKEFSAKAKPYKTPKKPKASKPKKSSPE